ncbi:MAG: N-acetylmuramoyl-L-alanine amidase [Bacteroidota bacterium]
MKKLGLTAIILSIGLQVSAQTAKYMQAIARPGDGVYSILRAFQLDKYPCNISEFYRINGLDKKSHLIVNKSYKLPLYRYTYNGKSIRSTIGDNDWDRAVRIQNYNREMVKVNLQNQEYEASMELWVPHHELDCKRPKTISKDDTDPVNSALSIALAYKESTIFGEKYKDVDIVSKKLKGKVFYLVSGHGGPDPGAIGKRGGNQLCEDEYAYDVTLRTARELMKHSATVHLIIRDKNDGIRDGENLKCDYDEVCYGGKKIPRQPKERLGQRADAVNRLFEHHKKIGIPEEDQYLVVIHVDSRSTSQRIDIFFYHYPESETGKALAKTMQDMIKSKYKKYQPNRGYFGPVNQRDLFMLRETKPQATYIELGNIRNPSDQKRLLQRNRALLAEWFAEGLINHATKK